MSDSDGMQPVMIDGKPYYVLMCSQEAYREYASFGWDTALDKAKRQMKALNIWRPSKHAKN